MTLIKPSDKMIVWCEQGQDCCNATNHNCLRCRRAAKDGIQLCLIIYQFKTAWHFCVAPMHTSLPLDVDYGPTTSLDVEALRALAAQPDRADAARAHNIITKLRHLAGRVTAAEVIKHYFDLTGYRALLSAAPGGARLRRNVDKLLADAHRSRLVSLGEFLEYVQTLRDVGARKGEALVEVEGALQLMTVHTAKGLEFPLVVIIKSAEEP